MGLKLDATYFQQNDVVSLAKDLIGKRLVSCLGAIRTSGLITETEAYRGWGDKACHAHLQKRTQRTAVMYEPGGVAYVYLCYGIHDLFNIVTNVKDQADAILIRAIQPEEGIATMLNRRAKEKADRSLAAGPGNLSKALGISTKDYGISLEGNLLFLEDIGLKPAVESRKRIGIDYAEEDALLPWRFIWKDSPHVSKK